MTAAGHTPSSRANVTRGDLRALVDKLVHLGLSEPIAEAYVRLTLMRGAKASELAAAMDVGRTEAYRLLNRLVEQRLAQMTMDRPVRFWAYPLDHVLEVMTDDAREREENLERARSELAPLIEGLRAAQPESDAPTFRLVKGRPHVLAQMQRLAAEARESFVAIQTDPASNAAAAQTGLFGSIFARAADGIDVRILWGEAGDGPPRDFLPRRGFEMRALPDAGAFFFAIADGRELVTLAVADASPRLHAESEVALVTTAPALVASHLALFESWWPTARRIA